VLPVREEPTEYVPATIGRAAFSVGTVTIFDEAVSTSSERPAFVPVAPNTMYFSRSLSVKR
jgi:hypothetical protein